MEALNSRVTLIEENNPSRNSYEGIIKEVEKYLGVEDFDDVITRLSDEQNKRNYRNCPETIFEETYKMFAHHIERKIHRCASLNMKNISDELVAVKKDKSWIRKLYSIFIANRICGKIPMHFKEIIDFEIYSMIDVETYERKIEYIEYWDKNSANRDDREKLEGNYIVNDRKIGHIIKTKQIEALVAESLFEKNKEANKEMRLRFDNELSEDVNWHGIFEEIEKEKSELCNRFKCFVRSKREYIPKQKIVPEKDLKKILHDHVIGISYLTLDMYKIQKKDSEHLIPLKKAIEKWDYTDASTAKKQRKRSYETIVDNNKPLLLRKDKTYIFGAGNKISKFGIYYNKGDDYKLTDNGEAIVLANYYSEFTINMLYNYKTNPYLGNVVKYSEFVKEISKSFWKNEDSDNERTNQRLVFESYVAFDFLKNLLELLRFKNSISKSAYLQDVLRETMYKYVQIPCVFGRSYFVQWSLDFLKKALDAEMSLEKEKNIIDGWKCFNERMIAVLSQEIIPLFTYCYFILYFEVMKRKKLNFEDFEHRIEEMKYGLKSEHEKISFFYFGGEESRKFKCEGHDIGVGKISSRRIYRDFEMESYIEILECVFGILREHPVTEPRYRLEKMLRDKFNIPFGEVNPNL